MRMRKTENTVNASLVRVVTGRWVRDFVKWLKAEDCGYAESKYTTDTAELWLEANKTKGCAWKVVEI